MNTNRSRTIAALAAVVALCLSATACIVPAEDGTLEREQAGAALDGPQCRNEVVDVNGCGDPGDCRELGARVEEDRECCAPRARQHVTKFFFDCNADGRADCEYQMWYGIEDVRCGAVEVVEVDESAESA